MEQSENAYSRRSFFGKSALSIASIAASRLPGSQSLNMSRKHKIIPTATGCVNVDKIGTTLMHEHILWFSGPGLGDPNYVPIPDNLIPETIDYAVDRLNEAARVGIDTIVDLTPHRPIDLYQRIASRTKINIILSSGFYRRAKSPSWKAAIDDEKEMEALMMKEITEGIDHTKIKAGIIKIAEESGELSSWEKKVFSAAARVSSATGTPITTHTGNAIEQFNFLMKAGADPRKIVLSHVDVGRKGNPGELLALVKEGVFVEVDTFGQDYYTPKEELVSFLRSLCDAGYSDKVIISIDSNWHWETGKKIFEGSGSPNFDPNAPKRTFVYMLTDAVPMLLKAGFSKKEIDTFLINNPHSYFSR